MRIAAEITKKNCGTYSREFTGNKEDCFSRIRMWVKECVEVGSGYTLELYKSKFEDCGYYNGGPSVTTEI